MKVFMTGATGFTGSRIVPKILQEGYPLHCLVRKTSDLSGLPADVILHTGDLNDLPELIQAMRGCDTLVNTASLGFGHAANIVEAAQAAGIQRAVFLSTTAIFTQLNSKSKKVRLDAEEIIQKSGLDFTILRPTMIYGSQRDRNMSRLIKWLKTIPIAPIFGPGTYLQQPVFVDDVAQAVIQCLHKPATIGKSYNIAGLNALTYNQVIDTISQQMGRKIIKLFINHHNLIKILRFFERLKISLPIKAEQVMRLNENKDFSIMDAQRDFDYQPLSFAEGIQLELAALKTGR